MRIRRLTRDDIGAASRIVGLNYHRRYAQNARGEIAAMFKSYRIRPRYLTVEEKGKVVGFGGYIHSWMDYSIYQIFWINIDPAWQGNGLGTKLVGRIIKEIKAIRGIDRKASMIQLTTDKPEFYRKRFGFRTLARFGKGYRLMVLDV